MLFPHYQAFARDRLGSHAASLLTWVIVQNAATGIVSLVAGPFSDRRGTRIVLVWLVALSSLAHRMSAVDFDDPHYRTRPYQKWQAYGQAKTANSLFAVGFHQRFKDQGVIANAVMPGGIMTPLQRHLPREEMIAMGWMDEAGKVADGFKTTEQGASTSVWAAVGPELTGIGGLYLENCAQAVAASKDNRFVGVEPWALDAEAAEKLWDLSVKTSGIG
jgi:NAD(P)-dependent dehydrogenase (short-subunit alcohol dehydrogenase family)